MLSHQSYAFVITYNLLADFWVPKLSLLATDNAITSEMLHHPGASLSERMVKQIL